METFRRRVHQATPRLWMTYVLMGLVGAGYLWQIFVTRSFLEFDSPGLIAAGSNYGPRTLNGEWWRLLSCVFLHGSLIHLAMNMYCFYSFGPLVERLVGNWGMAVLFIVSGLFGSITSVNWNPNVNSIGASGAVFGVAGALLGYLLHQRRNIPAALLSELAKGATTFVVLNIFLAAAIKHIDQAAHIGGLVGGFVIGLIQASDASRESLAWRPLRNGLVALLGVFAFVAVTQFHREPPFRLAQPRQLNGQQRKIESQDDEVAAKTAQVNKEIRGILTEADRIEEVARAITSGAESDETDESAVVRMKRDVLGPWRIVRERLDTVQHEVKDLNPIVSRIADYYAKREASWLVFVEHLKTLDAKKWSKFESLKAEADQADMALTEEFRRNAQNDEK